MKPLVALAAALALSCAAAPAGAQEPPPRIPIVAIDLHGTVPLFPGDANVAASRGLTVAELPGRGLGGQLGLQVYPVKWRAITFGVGGELLASRARQTPPQGATTNPVTETFRTLDAQLSLNFGSGNGWSYLSGGVGRSNWSIVPDAREPIVGDTEVLKTVNYGGGARWFIKPHLAFSFDVRFYAINPGTASFGYPGSPRITFRAVAAGVSLKP